MQYLHYNGPSTINATKAVRAVTKMGLKEAKDVIDGGLFTCTAKQRLNIMSEYFSAMRSDELNPYLLLDRWEPKWLPTSVTDISKMEATSR